MGKTNDANSHFDSTTRYIIRKHARSVVQAAGLPRYDREDVEQELLLHLWRRQGRYTPARGKRSTFVRCVIERKAAVLLASARSQRRDRRREAYSLDECVGEGSNETRRIDLFDQDDYLRSTNGSEQERVHRQLDVERLLARLRPEDQRLARLLMKDKVAEVARELGVPRSSLYSQIARIRSQLEVAGLNKPA